jgi:hypothetical protein
MHIGSPSSTRSPSIDTAAARAAAASRSHPDVAPADTGTSAGPICYNPALHGSLDDFRRDPGFAVHRLQFEQDFDLLLRRCKALEMPQPAIDAIGKGLRACVEEIFSERHRSPAQNVLIHCTGKQSLDQFARLACDDSLDGATVSHAMHDLAHAASLPAEEFALVLAQAAGALASHANGLTGALFRVKADILRELLGAHAEHAWNTVAPRFGLPRCDDPSYSPDTSDDAMLRRFEAGAARALDPGNVALAVARQFQREFLKRAEAEFGGMPQRAPENVHRTYCEMLAELTTEFDFGLADSLSVRLTSLIRYVDAEGLRWAFPRPCLVPATLDIVESMQRLNLAWMNPGTRSHGEWATDAGQRAQLCSYGDTLAWVTVDGADPRAPTAKDLLLLKQACGAQPCVVPGAALDQAIHNSVNIELMKLPEQWFDDPARIRRLLLRLDDAQTGAYLNARSAWLLEAGTRFCFDDRVDLLGFLLNRGRRAALDPLIEALVRKWGGPDSAQQSELVQATLDRHIIPALMRAGAARGHPEHEIQDCLRPPHMAWMFKMVEHRLPILLKGAGPRVTQAVLALPGLSQHRP